MTDSYRELPLDIRLAQLEKRIEELEARLEKDALQEHENNDSSAASTPFIIMLGKEHYKVHDFSYGLQFCPACEHKKRTSWIKIPVNNTGEPLKIADIKLFNDCLKLGISSLFLRECVSCQYKWVVALKK